MSFALKASTASAPAARTRSSQRTQRSRSLAIVVRAEQGEGFVGKDNSGRSNNFPTISKAYVSSPTSSAVAGTGLGGTAGAAVLAAAVAVIGLATVSLASNPVGETLQTVVNSYDGDTLTAIASRLSASL